jgi:hypothetical protein
MTPCPTAGPRFGCFDPERGLAIRRLLKAGVLSVALSLTMTERALEFQPFGREQLAGAFEIHL